MTQESRNGDFPEIRVPAALTFAGLALGLVIGVATAGAGWLEQVLPVTDAVGSLWLKALKMTVLPLVVGLLFTGIVQTVAIARAGAIAACTLGLFLAVLTAGAVLAAVVMPLLLNAMPVPAGAAMAIGTGGQSTGPIPGAADFLAGILPDNVFAAAAEGAMLPVVVFVALFALASTRLATVQRDQLAGLFRALAGAMMVLIGWILAIAPLGVFALALGLAARSGAAAIGTLAHYILTVSTIGAVVLIAAYVVAAFAGRVSPIRFARAVLPAQAVAISTQSSLASLPAMLAGCRRLGIPDATSDFVLPLAVALLRATSPAMNLAVVIYIARLSGVELDPSAIVAGAAVAVLVSLGTVSLPGTISFIATIAPIAVAMGVPVEPLALLVAVEVLPDVMRTLANVTMDVAVTTVVDRQSDDMAEPPAEDQK